MYQIAMMFFCRNDGQILQKVEFVEFIEVY